MVHRMWGIESKAMAPYMYQTSSCQHTTAIQKLLKLGFNQTSQPSFNHYNVSENKSIHSSRGELTQDVWSYKIDTPLDTIKLISCLYFMLNVPNISLAQG